MKTKVRLQLDNREASSQLRRLTQQAERAGQAVSGKVRGAFMGAVVGGAAGAIGGTMAQARSALTAPTSSGLSDLVAEALGGYGAQFAQLTFGELDEKAIAMQRARQAAGDIFGFEIGRRGEIPEQVKAWMAQRTGIEELREKGRQLLSQQADRVDVIGALVEKLEPVLSQLADKILDGVKDAINPLSWFK